MIDDAFCDFHGSNIAVTLRAGHGGGDVRSVVKPHVSFVIPSINALPGNIFTAIEICRDLLNRRFVRCDSLVTGHAPSNVWDDGLWPGDRAGMTIEALHLCLSDMRAVIVGNRLVRFGAQSEKMPHCHRDTCMCRGEDTGRSDRRIIEHGLPSQKDASDSQDTQDHEQGDRSSIHIPRII